MKKPSEEMTVSVQFGRWNLDGQSVDPDYIRKVRTLFAPYAPDSTSLCVKSSYFLLYGPFHTTTEARLERQPATSPAGTCTVWDGRLDNRNELREKAKRSWDPNATDLDIVSWLYENEGTDALPQLVGDWCLSVMHQHEKRLVLAVDSLGTRPLYYIHCGRYIAWSSVLEPLIVLGEQKFTLCEDYLAGWLCGFPEAHLTPYCEIHAVPPASYVELRERLDRARKYWDFHPQEPIHACHETEYEERFRHFFTQAVRRRLRSSGPVVSELSGGMDSSSIVCVADQVLEDDPSIAPRLDTLSYVDDDEPDWNERPFINEVETKRRRSRLHIDVSTRLPFIPARDGARFSATPAIGVLPSLPEQKTATYLRREGVRVVLSGLGGDECTGGVPDGTPELADLLIQARLAAFVRRTVAWSLANRLPFLHVSAGVVAAFLPQSFFRASPLLRKVPWLNKQFERRNRENLACLPLRLKVLGLAPSFQENLHTLENLRRQIACAPPALSPVRERRYPFLDRDLLEFLYSVPREQMLQPGRRRSLMRRALRGIVPEAVLERKRKAFVVRAPIRAIQMQSQELREWTKDMLSSDIGVIDLKAFQRTLAAACRGDEPHLWRIRRTLALESWLRDLRVQSVLHSHATLPPAALPADSAGLQPEIGIKSPQLGKSKQKGGEQHEIREAGNP